MNRAETREPDPVGVAALAAVLGCFLWAAPARAAGEGGDGAPPAQTDTAAKLLKKGWNALELVNYPAAQETFQKALAASPTRPQKAEALFAQGHLWQYRRPGADMAKARALYEDVARDYKDTPSGPLALMALARLADTPEYERDRRREEARSRYRQILTDYPKSFLAHEATLRLSLTYLEDYSDANATDVGAKMLGDHLAAHPDNFLATAMHTQLAGLYQRRGEFRRAVEAWIAADAADAKAAEAELTDADRKLPLKRRLDRVSQSRVMDAGTRAAAYYRTARLAEVKLRDYALAVRWYERIVYEIVRDNRYYISKLSAERCRKLARDAGIDVPPHPLAGKEPRP